MAFTYLYLRTEHALAASRNSVEHLTELRDYSPSVFCFGSHRGYWRDGCVIRLWSRYPPQKLAEMFARDLNHFLVWSIHDGKRCIEKMGRLHKFIDAVRNRPFCQIYLRYNKQSSVQCSAADRLQSELSRHGTCMPGMDYSNGSVLCFATGEGEHISYRRCQPFANKIPLIMFVDTEGNCSSMADGPQRDEWVWQPFDLDHVIREADMARFESD